MWIRKSEEHIQAAVEEGETEVQQERTLRKSERKGAKSKKVIEREEEKEEKNKEAKQKVKNREVEPQLEKVGEVLYCSCRQPYDYSKHECMLKCDSCVKWYHCECVDFICKKCSKDGKDHITERPKANSRKTNPNKQNKEIDQKREEMQPKR